MISSSFRKKRAIFWFLLYGTIYYNHIWLTAAWRVYRRFQTPGLWICFIHRPRKGTPTAHLEKIPNRAWFHWDMTPAGGESAEWLCSGLITNGKWRDVCRSSKWSISNIRRASLVYEALFSLRENSKSGRCCVTNIFWDEGKDNASSQIRSTRWWPFFKNKAEMTPKMEVWTSKACLEWFKVLLKSTISSTEVLGFTFDSWLKLS